MLLGTDATVETRRGGLRLWALVAGGLFAMAPPNVLLPDPNTRTLQLLNWSPRRLLGYQLQRMGPLLVLALVPAVLLAYVDLTAPVGQLGAKTVALAQVLLVMIGAAADSFIHFATLGPRSQAWQEGRRGTWYARAVEEKGQGVNLPRGLVPALFATTRCFTVALAAVLVSAYGSQAGWALLAWGAGLFLIGWAALRLRRHRATYDRHFYQTTAFYDQVMGGPGPAADAREAVPFDALYWVPTRWRAAVWASLRQMDRFLPLGRLVAVAHVGLWLLCIRGVADGLVSGFLLILLLAQTAACGLLAQSAAAPPPFQRSVQSVLDWIGTRTFVNLRWGAAHIVSLGLVVLFSDRYGWGWMMTWIGVHIVLSVGAATVVTLAHEGRARWASA